MRYRVIEDAYLGDKKVASAGDIVWRYTGHTYGCIRSSGVAISHGGPTITPFLEVARSNLIDLGINDRPQVERR